MEAVDLLGLGDHPALDFLNSTTAQGAVPVDGLSDGRSYLTWLSLAGFIGPADVLGVEQRFRPGEIDSAAARAGDFRERLRPVVAAWSAQGERVPAPFWADLNAILAADRSFRRAEPDGDGLVRLRELRYWHTPDQLLVPPAIAVAELLSGGDASLVRHCGGPDCSMWFYDRTKAHRRRWCSMALCGNRVKARAYRDRLLGHEAGSDEASRGPSGRT
jgi:predicted RNA-binding Zn ribbon-like protein